MVHCYEHAVESVESVRRLVGESRDASFQLNERQCQILADILVGTIAFLEERGVRSKFGRGARSVSLLHLCATIKRAELLVKKCCCKDLESWLVAAMILVEIQEEFVAIILDIHLWRMLLDFAINSAKGLSGEKEEQMKIMDEEYHELFKDLHRERHALQQAAAEDKETIISKTSRIAEIHGSTNRLVYLRAVYLQSWFTGNAAHSDMELREYKILHMMGRGACGVVFKVKWLGVECALKMLNVQDEKEATALKGLFHPNIIRLFNYWEEPPETRQSHLLMELMPKDLSVYMEELLKSTPSSSLQMGQDIMPFSLPVAIDIMHQIAQAMQYMHEKHLTHRDLKPSNILIKERPNVGLMRIDGEGYLDIKLADFGLVKAYANTSTTQQIPPHEGTRIYGAPEIFGEDLAQKRNYPPMADVWSFGVTCAQILSGKVPYSEFDNMTRFALQTRICKEGLRPSLPRNCPSYLAFCIKNCWELQPKRRPNFASICKMLRYAKLLSLGVTTMDESRLFFAFITRSDQVKSFNGSSALSVRFSTFIQSSLRFMRIGVRPVPKIAEDLPSAAILQNELYVPTANMNEGSPQPVNEDIAGRLGTPESLERKDCTVMSPVNHPKKHPVPKTKKVGQWNYLCNFQDWLERKNPEPELPKFRKAASASNSPAPVRLGSRVSLPKPRSPSNREGLKSHDAPSSSHGVRNKGSGYQSQDPPPGFYQDNDTGPSPKTLAVAVLEVQSAVNQFAKVLISDMNKHPVELEYFRQTILLEVKAEVVRRNHWKFRVQAFICKRFFDGFDSPNGYFGIEYFKNDLMSTLISSGDFSKYKDRIATVSMLMDSDSPDGSFLGRFCFKKFKFISGQPLPIYKKEWDAVESERHPKTEFYQSFLKVAVSVWLLHRLVHSFEQKVEMLTYEKGSKFQRTTMESVVPGGYEEEDEEKDVHFEVGFSVIPGFLVSGSVVKSTVYLRNRNIHPIYPGKETPGRSLQTPKGFSSYANYVDDLLPVRDAGSSASVVKVANFWEPHRQSLSPDNQGPGSRNGRTSRNEQESVADAKEGSSHERDSKVYKLATPPSRASNHRGPPRGTTRGTKSSEMRRLSTSRANPSG